MGSQASTLSAELGPRVRTHVTTTVQGGCDFLNREVRRQRGEMVGGGGEHSSSTTPSRAPSRALVVVVTRDAYRKQALAYNTVLVAGGRVVAWCTLSDIRPQAVRRWMEAWLDHGSSGGDGGAAPECPVCMEPVIPTRDGGDSDDDGGVGDAMAALLDSRFNDIRPCGQCSAMLCSPCRATLTTVVGLNTFGWVCPLCNERNLGPTMDGGSASSAQDSRVVTVIDSDTIIKRLIDARLEHHRRTKNGVMNNTKIGDSGICDHDAECTMAMHLQMHMLKYDAPARAFCRVLRDMGVRSDQTPFAPCDYGSTDPEGEEEYERLAQALAPLIVSSTTPSGSPS